MKRDLLSLRQYSTKQIIDLLRLASKLKKNPRYGADFLRGKSFALIFQKPSNRTRVSFETGIHQLGGNAIYLGPHDIDLGKREPTADVARTLSRYVSGIVARVFSHNDIAELAKYATVPVINGLSNRSHPCQALADIFTVQEVFGKFKGIKMAYIGDGNNMCNSLLITCAKVGLSLSVATPKGYEPSQDCVKTALKDAKSTGAVISCVRSPEEAIKGAHVVYTDTWVSMGQEKETAKRFKDFKGYQINEKMVTLADKKFIFMHCLPAHRGQEVSAGVIDGKHSVIFDQAENRLHIQKAILVLLCAPKHK